MTGENEQSLAAAYALDVLEESEKAAFEQRLAASPALQQEVRELAGVVELLAYGIETATPPPALRTRILAAAGEERRAPHPAPAAVPPPRARYLPWVAAAAAIILSLGMGLAFWYERADREALETAFQAASADRLVRDARLAAQDSVLAAVLGAGVRTAGLAAPGEAPAARVYLNAERQMLVLAAHSLPPAPPGRTYQLWGLLPQGEAVSLGIFDTQPGTGQSVITFHLPAGVLPGATAVTEEPEGGSSRPTSEPRLSGQFGAD